jgi:multimeric flavodoxin WrbA
MNIAIISGSNVRSSGNGSISLRTGELLKNRLKDIKGDCNINLVDLRDYKLTPCGMCESCAETQRCVEDEDFNRLYDTIKKADELIFICPHYAPIPSKLVILFEKLEEMSYLGFCSGKKDFHPTNGKKAGIIAHGGMTEGYEQLYKDDILTPLTNVMECIGMKVINKMGNKPICFGVQDFEKVDNKRTYDIIYDMDGLQQAVDSFVKLYARS